MELMDWTVLAVGVAALGVAIAALRLYQTKGEPADRHLYPLRDAVGNLTQRHEELIGRVTTVEGTVTTLADKVTMVERRLDDHVLDTPTTPIPPHDSTEPSWSESLNRQLYFAVAGFLMTTVVNQGGARLLYPGAIRCEDNQQREAVLTRLEEFLRTFPATRVGGVHRMGSWHFKFHLYFEGGFDEFHGRLSKGLRMRTKESPALALKDAISGDPATYLQIGPAVIIRTGFASHATILRETAMEDFARQTGLATSRLDNVDPSLILGKLSDQIAPDGHFEF